MYGKIFASLYQGTLRGRSNEILVFTNLIACATQAGTVDKHWRAIAEETGISVDAVKEAIANLEAPDPESRSSEAQGARLVRLDDHRAWGWRIVNHGKYRSIRNEEDRNAYMRDYMSNRRKAQYVNDRLTPVNTCKPRLAQAEAEAEAEAEATMNNDESLCVPKGTKAKRQKFTPPTTEEAKARALELNLPAIEADKFLSYYQSNGWRVGRNPMKCWRSAMATWAANWSSRSLPAGKQPKPTIPGLPEGYEGSVGQRRNRDMGYTDEMVAANTLRRQAIIEEQAREAEREQAAKMAAKAVSRPAAAPELPGIGEGRVPQWQEP